MSRGWKAPMRCNGGFRRDWPLARWGRLLSSNPFWRWGHWGCWGCIRWVLGACWRGGSAAEYRGENLGVAPSRKKAARREPARLAAWTAQGPIAAVMEKELRTLMRTLPLLYAMGAPLILVMSSSAAFLKGRGPDGHTFPLGAAAVRVLRAARVHADCSITTLAPEGAGIQLYFLSPTPIRTVLLAKNLFHSALFLLDGLLAGILASCGWESRTVRWWRLRWRGCFLRCRESGRGKHLFDHHALPSQSGTDFAAARIAGQCARQPADSVGESSGRGRQSSRCAGFLRVFGWLCRFSWRWPQALSLPGRACCAMRTPWLISARIP